VASYSARALVLRKTKLGETDTILTLLAEDGRQIRAVAKGLRKPGGRFGARLEPYSVVDLLLHSGRSLDVITEAASISAHSGLREDLDRSAAAAVIADLLDKISVEGQPEARLFALATTSLDAFEDASAEVLPALVVAFLVKAMAMHGYRPQLDSCACCSAELGDSRLFSVQSGGAVCASCGGTDGSATRFDPEGRAWLRSLLAARMAEVGDLEMPPAAVAECFALVRAFIAYHVPARMRALDYYASVLPSGC
jgi:DNA repair protein RecO (recombination protein O)